MSDTIKRVLERIELLRRATLQNVENVRGVHGQETRVRVADTVVMAYDDVIRILREEQRRA